MKVSKKILLILILLISFYSNVSMGAESLDPEVKKYIDDGQKRYYELMRLIESFDDYKNFKWSDEKQIFYCPNHEPGDENGSYIFKTYDEMKSDIEFLDEYINTKIKYELYPFKADGPEELKKVDILRKIVESYEAKEENENSEENQEKLKNCPVSQMWGMYIKNNYSTDFLPNSGGVKEEWIRKLKETDEYKYYINATSKKDKSEAYKTGEGYYYMIEKIDSTANERRKAFREDKNKSPIYSYPEKNSGTLVSGLDDMIDDADNFVNKADDDSVSDVLKTESLQKFSKNFHSNILLTIGVVVAVIVGLFIGIKFMIGGAEEKANMKELLVPYIAGCILVFGSFAIWKIVVTILTSV